MTHVTGRYLPCTLPPTNRILTPGLMLPNGNQARCNRINFDKSLVMGHVSASPFFLYYNLILQCIILCLAVEKKRRARGGVVLLLVVVVVVVVNVHVGTYNSPCAAAE
jgi:hypothetical protein